MPAKDPEVQKSRILESDIKSDFQLNCKKWYPLSHVVIIPATFWRLLPYDMYILYEKIFRAVELKIDDHEVEAHQYQALFEVVENGGYGFVVRWLNTSKQFVVENFATGATEVFKGQASERQLSGNSTLDAADHPHKKTAAFRQTIDYIYSFRVSPLEEQIQKALERKFKLISAKLRKM